MPQAPEFWSRTGLVSDLLLPLAWSHAALGAARRRLVQPWHASVPVLCVGNLVTGGAGKTPVVLSLAQILREAGKAPHILSRGYGGSLHGPLRVDPAKHTAVEVGDEPLLLAEAAPTWIGADRARSARAAIAAGAEMLLLDDGFQNPMLHQDLGLLVIDGAYGLGNGRVIPAGPLREPASSGVARAQALVVVGADRIDFAPGDKLLLAARLVPQEAADLAGRKVIAFAGIGRPEKFFLTLRELGSELIAAYPFPDHHRYREGELAGLADAARGADALLVTTEKDCMRLTPQWRARMRTLKVVIEWSDRAALLSLLVPLLGAARG